MLADVLAVSITECDYSNLITAVAVVPAVSVTKCGYSNFIIAVGFGFGCDF